LKADLGTSREGEVDERVRRLQHHEGASFSRGNQINNRSKKWRQNHQVKALAAIQVRELHEHSDWRRMKKNQVVGPRNKQVMVCPLVKVRKQEFRGKQGGGGFGPKRCFAWGMPNVPNFLLMGQSNLAPF
jgi:phage-related protein